MKTFLIMIVVLCAIIVSAKLIGCDADYAYGFKDGYVRGINKEGLHKLTNHQDMVVDLIVPFADKQPIRMSILKEDMYKQLEGFDFHTMVRVHYRQVMINSPLKYTTSYRVIKVEKRDP